jgi:hypothetical protein
MQRVGLFGLDSLADLGARSGVDMRSTLLRVLTDLYVHRLSHTPDEERHYTELALRLLDAVDVATRVIVAKRFAAYLLPPLRVLQRLAADVPEVAAEMRVHPLLQPSQSGDGKASGSDHALLPAEREPVQNKDDVASHIVDAKTANELNELFFAAGAEERRLILLNLPIVAPIEAGTVSFVQDASNVDRLETAALAGRRDDFAQQLALALRVTQRQANRIARDDLGEPVLVAAKVLGMRRDVLYRILMFLNPTVGHSVSRVHALATLYDEIVKPAAEGIVAIWQALQPNARAAAKYQPVTYDDQKRKRPSAPQRLAAAPPTADRRSAS